MDDIKLLIKRYPKLKECYMDIKKAADTILKCFKTGGRLYVCGNGGSAADSLHIVGELVKSFKIGRPVYLDFERKVGKNFCKKIEGGLPAIPLVENSALVTAVSNDIDADFIFAQQVYAYANKKDCLLGISTSGNAKNVINAFIVANALGCKTICLTGKKGGKSVNYANICVRAPETETFKIQELHLPIYHAICSYIESKIWHK